LPDDREVPWNPQANWCMWSTTTDGGEKHSLRCCGQTEETFRLSIVGRGDVPSTVLAMKGGAVDFLTKPLDEGSLPIADAS
jgi:DNA-binding NtrC family response regulator